MRRFFILPIVFLSLAFGQATIERYYGINNDDVVYSMCSLDPEFTLAGYCEPLRYGGKDIMVFNIDESGHENWMVIYGGPYDDIAYDIKRFIHRTYILCGTYDLHWDPTTSTFRSKAFAATLNEVGDTFWTKKIDTSYINIFYSTAPTSGGVVFCGVSQMRYDESSMMHFGDFLVVKLDYMGNIVWQRNFGGPFLDVAKSVVQTSDSNLVIAGFTRSSSGGMKSDIMAMKISPSGSILWNRTYTDSIMHIEATKVIETRDRNYIILGNAVEPRTGLRGIYIMKISPVGDVIWQNIIDFSGRESAGYDIVELSDGKLLVCGVLDPSSRSNALIVMLSSVGTRGWYMTFGGPYTDIFYSIIVRDDGAIFASGVTESFGAGRFDAYFVRYH